MENCFGWLAATWPNLSLIKAMCFRVKCLKGCLVVMEIKPLSVSRILPHTLTVWLHHVVLPRTDRRHFLKKGVVGFLWKILYLIGERGCRDVGVNPMKISTKIAVQKVIRVSMKHVAPSEYKQNEGVFWIVFWVLYIYSWSRWQCRTSTTAFFSLSCLSFFSVYYACAVVVLVSDLFSCVSCIRWYLVLSLSPSWSIYLCVTTSCHVELYQGRDSGMSPGGSLVCRARS
jgi:hypothetical protein